MEQLSIETLALTLKLSTIKNNYKSFLSEAMKANMDLETFLKFVLNKEIDARKNNGIKTRIKNAKFPYKKYLSDFKLNGYEKIVVNKINEIKKLDFIKNNENVLLVGTPGSGKTMLSIGLGIQACMDGYNVLFISVANLLIELREAMSKSQLNSYKNKFERYDLVILDEMGYVSFDKEGSEILFNLLSNRNDKGSIIINTNLKFNRWEEIFHDPVLTTAMVDRLAYKAHILDMSRETSYRYEETLNWMKEHNYEI